MKTHPIKVNFRCESESLLENAKQNPDLRYFSNSAAFDSLENAMQVTVFQGLYFEVWGERPCYVLSAGLQHLM
jgi:hypothetical protein